MPIRNPESELLLLCTSQHLSHAAVERIAELCRGTAIHWGQIRRSAGHHQIGPMVLANLLKVAEFRERAPAALLEAWGHLRIKNGIGKETQAQAVRDVIAFFAKRQTRVMLVKGVALDAVVYDNPWYTMAADADLLIDTPFRSLSQSEAVSLDKIIRGRRVELDYVNHHDLDMNNVLDIDYTRVWADAQSIHFRGETTYVMSPEDMMLAACVNLCRKRFQQLKAMAAIREIAVKFPDVDWDRLRQIAHRAGASRILYAALMITSYLLDWHAPDQAWPKAELGGARKWLIRHLCQRIGNHIARIPVVLDEPVGIMVRSELLRWLTYEVGQFRREMRARKDVRRYKADTATVGAR